MIGPKAKRAAGGQLAPPHARHSPPVLSFLSFTMSALRELLSTRHQIHLTEMACQYVKRHIIHDFEAVVLDHSESAYPYRSLAKNDIRLLKVLPGDGSLIKCLLFRVSLEQEPRYWALSYAWGNSKSSFKILLNDQPFVVMENLYASLQQFQQMTQGSLDIAHQYLWIDAICINQEDTTEKNIQVPRMTDIYSLADQVILWVGINPPLDDKGMALLFEHASVVGKLLDTIPKGQDSNEWMKSYPIAQELGSSYSAVLSTLEKLTTRDYFRRIWVTQEVLLARREPVLLAGPHSTRLIDIFKLTMIMELDDSRSLAFNKNLGMSQLLIARTLICYEPRADDGMRRMIRFCDPTMKAADVLVRLLGMTCRKRTTVPHDHFYGLLGIVGAVQGDELPEELAPDYDQSFAQVSHHYMAYIIERTQSIAIFGCYRNDLSGDVPSWVCDVRHLRGAPFTDREMPTTTPILSADRMKLTLRGSIWNTVNCHIDGDWEMIAILRNKVATWRNYLRILTSRITLLERSIFAPAAVLSGLPLETVRQRFIHAIDDRDATRGNLAKLWTKVQEGVTHDQVFVPEFDSSLQLFLNRCSPPWLVLDDGTIARSARKDAIVDKGDMICFFDGDTQPAIVRRLEEVYVLIGHCTFVDQIWYFKDFLESHLQKEVMSFTLV